MSSRSITHVTTDGTKTLRLCNPSEWWSPRSSVDVIVDIESGQHTYWAIDSNRIVRRIIVTNGRLSAPDEHGTDTLHGLPVC